MTVGADYIPYSAATGVSEATDAPKRRLPVLPVQAMLQAQQTLTAVERFSREHDRGSAPEQAKYYRDLIPLDQPKSGEQYAFQVDLDACTGCKACVSACHTLNGLDDGELWRTVGLLHGGTPAVPALQTVTTSCHHCIDPACMTGCPTRAYEKDPVTGIVKHLDDQCFGCAYCTLMCPYDAPKYNKAKGIVRKCDMCSERLRHGEAPACVQACPNQAISIQVVEKRAVVAAGDAQTCFVPGAATPDTTLPTTIYKSNRVMPRNMLPADFYHTSPEHSHPSLVIMLVLTQLSVGAFVAELLVERASGQPVGSPLVQTVFATLLAAVALGASVLHLGRPLMAWRAVLGLRTSWLSREAVALGAFALLAAMYGAAAAGPLVAGLAGRSAFAAAARALQDAAAVAGIAGVFCSVMVYVATRRDQWSVAQTGLKFAGTTILLGAATVLAVGANTAARAASIDAIAVPLLQIIAATTAVKVMLEAATFLHLRSTRHTTLKRMALLMLGDLRAATNLRCGSALVGGALLPVLVWLLRGPNQHTAVTTGIMLGLLLVGELAERYLFFRAAPASRMPGGIR